MLKEAKRKERLALKRAKRASSSDQLEKSEEVKMHDINKPITLDDLTNPNKQFMELLSKGDDKKQKLANALKANLKKRKEFKKKNQDNKQV